MYNADNFILILVLYTFLFVLLLGSYIALVATNKIKKRRMDKVLRLVAAYSLVVALVFLLSDIIFIV